MANIANPPICEYCGKPLSYKRIEQGSFVCDLPMPCDCEAATEASRREAEEAQRKERLEKMRVLAKRYDLAGIPPEHRRYDHELSESLADVVQAGRGLYIVGKVGRGKTTLACAIARRLIHDGHNGVKYLAAADFPEMISMSYRRGADATEADIIHKYASCNLLVLDDLGKGKTSDFVVSALFRLIDRRTRELRPMIVTSQYERDKLAEWLARGSDVETAESIASRLAGHCDRVLIEGDDLRITDK